jgi:hypothetical protein
MKFASHGLLAALALASCATNSVSIETKDAILVLDKKPT